MYFKCHLWKFLSSPANCHLSENVETRRDLYPIIGQYTSLIEGKCEMALRLY